MKSLATIALLACGAANSMAITLWDSTGISTGSNPHFPSDLLPAGRWQNNNANPINLTRVAFFGSSGASSNVKYVFANGDGAVLNVVEVFHSGSGPAIFAADVNWTVAPGATFMIASMHETGTWAYFHRDPPGTSQNSILGLARADFFNYSNPTFVGLFHNLEMSWRLEGSVVPEPATLAVVGLGMAALLRRKRRA